MRVDHARDRDPAARELLDDHRVGRQVEPHAAVLLGDRHAEQAELLHLLDDRLGEGVLVVVVLGVGQDLLVDELMHHLGDRLLLVGLLGVRRGGYGHCGSRSRVVLSSVQGEYRRELRARRRRAARPPRSSALIELARDGARREWTLRRDRRAQRARWRARCRPAGSGRGDVVMTLIGNRPEWVLAMLACFRIGAVVLPCTEQLRAKDLRLRLERRAPGADPRRRAQPPRARGGRARTCRGRCSCPTSALFAAEPAPAVELAEHEPVPDHVHERHRGRAQGGGARPALPARPAPAGRALARRRARASCVWCTAASGWSKSARNVFIAPWLRGRVRRCCTTRALTPHERLELLARERVERAVHGADRVPRDRQAQRRCARSPQLRGDGGRRRGAQPRGAARLAARRRASRSATATARPRPGS